MIHLNQVGYPVNLPKRAVITGKGEHCYVMSEHGEEVFKPILSSPRFDSASGDTVRLADFSEMNKPGKYFLFSDGLKKTFYICERPYKELAGALIKGMYYQRCGCALLEKHAGVYNHATCHTGKVKLIEDMRVELDVTGGWHDAGDYGRYIVPAAVTLAHMLYAYELFPQAFHDSLNIPESGNGVPDILNECRYELEWMLKMQRPDGGVYHKIATKVFAPFIMPEDDKEDLYLFRVTHTATAGFSASLALAYRVFKPFDPDFAGELLEASIKAWDWLENNSEYVPFKNPEGYSSGAYGDDSCEDELFWASCELYAAMNDADAGQKQNLERFSEMIYNRADTIDISAFGWRNTGGFGSLCCLFVAKDLDNAFIDRLRENFLDEADERCEIIKQSCYETALEEDGYVWGSILPILNNAILLICAKLLSGTLEYQNAAQSQLDYLLGMNATGYSFVTGFGENAFRYPHHRPSFADCIDNPVPGLVSGGPNNKYKDALCKKLVPMETPPAKSYIDDTWTASSNENAIYWNSSAIFVAAYFDQLSHLIVG